MRQHEEGLVLPNDEHNRTLVEQRASLGLGQSRTGRPL